MQTEFGVARVFKVGLWVGISSLVIFAVWSGELRVAPDTLGTYDKDRVIS